MHKGIFVIAEQRDRKLMPVSLELLGKARELADRLKQPVIAVLLGNKIDGEARRLADHGADEVIVVEDALLDEYLTEPYAFAVAQLIRERSPEIVLFGATSIGRDLAPRISARIHTGLTADCTQLDIDDETGLLLMTRPAFGGNIMATIVCEKHRPQMATVRPGVMEAAEYVPEHPARITPYTVDFTGISGAVRLCGVIPRPAGSADISAADVLVSGGRGMGSKEGFDRLIPLAALLGGQVSASRACVDLGWAPKDVQVGQTGKTVRPSLYLACGISGAIQHTAGMEGSDTIIAINSDEHAQIFDIADLGIVGDVHTILPLLTQALKNRS